LRKSLNIYQPSEALDALIGKLRDAPEPRVQRVLASIYHQLQNFDQALALEVDYIQQGAFTPSAAAIRKGLVYAAHGQHAEAVTAFKPHAPWKWMQR
jgi:predicted negative regulator of RcsB-dependent stress response